MDEKKFDDYKKELNYYLNGCVADKELERAVEAELNKTGIYYRIFARTKAPQSAAKKLINKREKYLERGKGMQDIIGVRIVLYYQDDIEIVQNILIRKYNLLREDSEIDIPKESEFAPIRRNLIFKLPNLVEKMIPEQLWEKFDIEKTFEVQIRTIFSEGWYEVEHDIRYKHEIEWKDQQYYKYSRGLNRINATLETCDFEILREINDLSYDCYKRRKIVEMLRYKFRIRLENEQISDELLQYIKENDSFFKNLFRVERGKILCCISNSDISIMPKSLNNLIFICNELEIHDSKVSSMMSEIQSERICRGIQQFARSNM